MMRRQTIWVIGLASALVCWAVPAVALPMQDVGSSRSGAPLAVEVRGDPTAETRIVVLGQMHGNEPAGRRVIKALRSITPPDGAALWLIPSMNPDGHAARTRGNARGVDLNRNFPADWRANGAGTSRWSGPRAASEPETRAMMRFLQEVKPTAVLSFHQPLEVVDITHPQSRKAGRLLARWMGLPARVVRCSGPCHGTLTDWVTRELDAIAITVELPASVTSADIDRAANATQRLTRWLNASHPRTR
jgi:protein MpaA